MIAKILCAALAATFAAAAAVQLNDPDPVAWFCVYAVVAVVLAMAVLGRYSSPLIGVAGLACTAGFFYLVPAVVELLGAHHLSLLAGPMSPDQPFIEESRESLGLLLALLALGYVYWLARKSARIPPA